MRLRKLPTRSHEVYTESITRFRDLPLQVQAEIFDWLQPTARQKLRLVSRSWNHLIGQLFETELRIENDEKKVPVLLGTEARFLSVHFVSFTQCRLLGLGLSLFQSFCLRVQRLTLSGLTLTSNLVGLLKSCTGLKSLRLASVQLSTSKLKVPEGVQAWVPALQSLTFCSDDGENQDGILLLQLLARILETGTLRTLRLTIKKNPLDFSDLERSFLVGSIPAEAGDGPKAPIMYLLNRIIVSNKATLRSISIEALHSETTNYKSVSVELHPGRSTKVHLKSFSTVDVLLRPNLEPIPWVQVLSRQEHLEELSLTAYDRGNLFGWVQGLGTDILLKNTTTLTSIKLDFSVSVLQHQPIWDADLFSACSALRKLDLRFWPMQSYSYYVLAGKVPSLNNLEKLPGSLVHLATNFTVVSHVNRFSEVEFKNFGRLETLFLFSTPWFTLNGSHFKTYGLFEVKHLQEKIPKLKTIHLMVQTYRARVRSKGFGLFRTVSKGLMEKFESKTEVHDNLTFLAINLNN